MLIYGYIKITKNMTTLATILFIILLLNRKELNFLTSPLKKGFYKANNTFKNFAYKTYILAPIYELWETIRNTILYWVSIMTSIFLWFTFIMLCLYSIIIVLPLLR